MENKKCVVFYVGNGYSENVPDYTGAYQYSVDMRDNRENHEKMVFEPLKEQGYEIKVALVTNKHKLYEDFLKEYDSLVLEYDDYEKEIDGDVLPKYYNIRTKLGVGFGVCATGVRFLKMWSEVPKADIYIFLRADTWFKKSIKELSIDFEKINYLWRETDYRMFNEERTDICLKWPYEMMFWDWYYRVSGNIFHVVPEKFIHPFIANYWLEHLSLYFLLKDMKPFITMENINFMCGTEKCYVSDMSNYSNPYLRFNKRIETSP